MGAITGIATAAVSMGVAQLVAGVVDPQASPLITVGQAAIDATPEWLKSFAIRTFGSNDKTVLLAGIGTVLGLASIVLGVASIGRLRVGLWAMAAFGVLGVAAAATRPDARFLDVVPAIVGAAAGAGALVILHRALVPAESKAARPQSADDIDRRRFLLTAAGGVAVAAAAGTLGSFIGRRFRADASRAAVHIPAPASAAGSTSGLDIGVPGVSPFFTPNKHFYRVDTALLVPSVMAEEWRLRIHGMVEHELTLDYRQLLDRPLIERDITLTCVSNEVGGELAGNARWIGAQLKDILEDAGVEPGADQIVSTSSDGFTVGTPTAVVMDGRDAMLAVAMNGEALPLAHGFPVRMVVPGLYGYVSATKWVVDMQLTTFDAFDAYWIERGWAQQAPIKTTSRIDTPLASAQLSPGEIAVAGVAWAQHTGVAGVQVQVDDGPWADAELSHLDTIDTWRQWVYRWQARTGDHQLRARASDRTDFTQTAEQVDPFPDGAEGLHTIIVHVN